MSNEPHKLLPARPRRPARDPLHDAHCHRCGYLLRGLDPDQACPECGASVSDSLAAHQAQQARRERMTARSDAAFFSAVWCCVLGVPLVITVVLRAIERTPGYGDACMNILVTGIAGVLTGLALTFSCYALVYDPAQWRRNVIVLLISAGLEALVVLYMRRV